MQSRACSVSLSSQHRSAGNQAKLPDRFQLGVEVPLQFKAFEALCILVERAGLLIKDDLLCQLWPGTIVKARNKEH
jgi:hypothetical protein